MEIQVKGSDGSIFTLVFYRQAFSFRVFENGEWTTLWNYWAS